MYKSYPYHLKSPVYSLSPMGDSARVYSYPYCINAPIESWKPPGEIINDGNYQDTKIIILVI